MFRQGHNGRAHLGRRRLREFSVPEMLNNILKPEIKEFIEAKDFAALKAMTAGMGSHDLAELLGELDGQDMAVVFRLLPKDLAAETLGDMEIEQQEELVSLMSSERLSAILNDMAPDERTELLEELPGEMAQRLLNTLRGDQRDVALRLLAHPEDSIGRLMTPEYLAVKSDWTVQKVFDHIRNVGADKETLNVIYVVAAEWKLLGTLSLEQIVLAEPGELVADVMDPNPPALQADDDQESAVEIIKKYDVVALPVVDSRHILLGIVTVDDVLDVVEEEDTEDFQKMAGMAPLEYSYFGTSFVAMVGKRLPWLIMLLLAQMLTTLALTRFQVGFERAGIDTLHLFVALVIFMPLINSPAGNTGSQMAGLMIRGLAVLEIGLVDWRRVLVRELGRGLAMGLILAAMGYGAAMVFGPLLGGGQTVADNLRQIALSVAVAITAAVTLANLVGAMLPFCFKKFGLDPAVTSGPFIASTMDVLGIVIYFSTASALLTAMN
ncbi:MAG TPA: magnesium transporter [Phycisphaerae bacterium]|nr:magnesium transporter [Phycisphaerae bacterium]